MKLSTFVQVYGLALFVWPVFAGLCLANTSSEPSRTDIWDEHLVHPFDAIVLTEQQIDRFLARLSQSSGARAAELKKMRITQPQRFRWEIREEIATRFFQRISPSDTVKPKPAENVIAADGPSDAAVERYDALMAWLETTFPRQAEQLKANPAPSEARINELFSRYEPVMRAERNNPPLAEAMKEDIATQMRCDELLLELPYAGENDRQAIVGELEQLTSKRFDLIVLKRQLQHDQLRRRLERLSQELDKKKDELELLRNSKDQAVKERVKELVERTDKTDWN